MATLSAIDGMIGIIPYDAYFQPKTRSRARVSHEGSVCIINLLAEFKR